VPELCLLYLLLTDLERSSDQHTGDNIFSDYSHEETIHLLREEQEVINLYAIDEKVLCSAVLMACPSVNISLFERRRRVLPIKRIRAYMLARPRR